MSKGLESLYTIKKLTLNINKFYKEEINIIEKELKALEIIKRVYTDLCFILSFDTFEEYNHTCNLINTSVNLKYVNKEEFELLKEALR